MPVYRQLLEIENKEMTSLFGVPKTPFLERLKIEN